MLPLVPIHVVCQGKEAREDGKLTLRQGLETGDAN